VLRRIFGSKTEDVTGGWRKLHNEKLHNLYEYSSPSISRMMKPRMRWAGHVARTGRKEMHINTGGKVRRKETTRKIRM
jgi:hypothetical protein